MSDTPTRIGAYAIERRLGAGGMAETFVAVRRMQTIEQRVCLKRILPAYARNPEARRLFHREANISARLRHANLVQVLDVGEENGTPYLVMELVEGADLDHVIERAPGKRLSSDLVGYVMSEIAHGLHEAHGGDGAHDGVVHRDLSPSNVLLSTSGEVKVADFGIAKALSGDKATATSMRGKFAYMAPEQLDGAPLDTRADMYALGVLGYEMLAGVRPFEADADARLVLLITRNERRSIHEHVPDAPKELLETIEALLSPKKEDRPATGHDVVERLAPMLPAAVVARRKLGKFVTAAYEARMAAAAREPTTDRGQSAPALAATVMASEVARSTTPSTRPAAIDRAGLAAGTPMVASLPEATTEKSVPPLAPPAVTEATLAGSRRWGVGIATAAVLALVLTGGAYLAFGGRRETALALASVVPSTALVAGSSVPATPPPTQAVSPPTSTVGAPPPSLTPPLTRAVLPPSSRALVPAPTALVPSTTTVPPMTTILTEPADEASAADRGHVHVVVSPWGQVWIDGRFMGRAPIDTTLRAGSHRIAAGFGEPTVTRTVRVHAGGDERVELDVETP